MSRPDQPTVADVMDAAAKVAATHDELAELHRQAYEDAAGVEVAPVDSGSAESTALGH